MSELTSDEIRLAAEAVGRWHYNRVGDQDMWWGEGDGPAIYTSVPFSDADALALLEATGCQYTIDRHLRPEMRWIVYMEDAKMGNGNGEGRDLPTAAVRAVNAWASAKKSP